MPHARLDHDELIAAAHALAPSIRDAAAGAEQARRPDDGVIDAARNSGLFAMMVPETFGGHEADLDTFFEVTLILSQADPAMGWLLGFYIEHNYWACGFPASFQKELFADANYCLAPATLNPGAGSAEKVDGGYRLSGQWQWGTGILHADWVFAGAMVADANGRPSPQFFALPIDDVEPIDTWFMAGMCGTGSWDFRIDDAFVPDDRVTPMLELMNASGEAAELYDGDLYRTPLIPILAFAAATPMLGAAKMALSEYQSQVSAKIVAATEAVGGPERTVGKPSVAARAALTIEAAELLIRQVLAEVMEQRNAASIETRSAWQARMSHAVFMCREAIQDICSVTGASGSRLDNPIQRALRDITTASNHVIFDREVRYADYGRLLTGQPIQNLLI